ncbi:PKD domain-containing protein [Aquibium sp. ELW1220]|uniref:PKD domain-containing protein n=1 Tax=Aquibium sp. ELW1220 TaxID=2976766 RepID=UPI0025B26FD6|nr:PKD domain-containing protein [Aquibium sp. ELW1220]MDN2579020.1 PKD domain-containing protein [Aquibium sp. ELW1220]
MRALLARLLKTRAGRNAALLAAGMGSVLAPVGLYVNADAIANAMPRLAAFAMMGDEPFEPHLVVFGPLARVNEGDHDFRQVVRVLVPADAGRIHLRVFDPDTGGAFDEAKGGYDSVIRFSLFGAGARASIQRDAAGVAQENVEGTPLGTIDFGSDAAADGRWATLFAAEASSGIEVSGGREFLVLVEGLSGNDGNVFDVSASSSDARNEPIAGARLSTLMPTIQVPAGRDLGEMRLAVPEDAVAVRVENFDAAGGRIVYGGPFRSRVLAASGKNEWRGSDVELDGDEPGGPGSVTATNGSETPNDMTLFVTALDATGAERPLAVELPIRAVAPNRRPDLALAVEPLACRQIRFSAAGSSDPDGGAVTYRWRLGEDADWMEGETVTQSFSDYGVKAGRLEGFDASGQVASGSARAFSFFVKPPPVAAFEAPALVAQGAEVAFDGTGSSSPALPEGTEIARYRWDFGDGTVLVQEAGEPGFGTPVHRYDRFGSFTVTLTVTDSSDDPCNEAVATRPIAVNAPPVANAGGDRRIALGDEIAFDAGSPQGADGDIHAFAWDFGDGTQVSGAAVAHRYAQPGTYAVSLTVDDGRNAANSVARAAASVFVNAAPDATAAKTPDRLVAGAPGLFDASAASDPDGRITAHEWRFSDGTTSDKPVIRRSFVAPGTYGVTLTVTDDSRLANGMTTIERSFTVVDSGNDAPIAEAGGDREAVTGALVRFDGSGSRDPDGSILAYRWDFGDGTTAEGLGVDHVYHVAGTYRATLTVEDDSGRENAVASTSFDVIVDNRQNLSPQVRVGGDRAAFVHEIIPFDATGTTDPDGNVVAVEWDFGDGAKASGFEARHAYARPGSYKVHVLVRDDSGRRGSEAEARFTVTVTHPFNQPPDAAVAPELSLETGVPHLFDARTAADPDGRVTRIEWSFGDGAVSTEAAIAHAYAAPGTYFGKLRLVDDSGLDSGVTERKFVVFVEERRNARPVAEAGPDVAAIVGQRVDLDGGASTDADSNIVGYLWDFGNGRQAEGQKRSIVYDRPGTYAVTLTVTDGSGQDNASASDTLTVTVADRPNLAPVARVETDRPAAIDEPIAFSGAASDDPDGNILSYDWDFGDGAAARGRDVVHRYSRSGLYVARLTVTDDSGLANDEASAERRILVNQPPVADAGPDQHVTASVVEFDAGGSVDSDGAIAIYRWDFGDGETGAGRTIAHTYRSPGTYAVTLSIEDDSGTIRNGATDTMTVRVNALPVADAGFDMVAAPGETLTFDGRRSEDPDGTITRHAWNFRDGAAAEGEVVEHAFARPGTYTVELTVEDDSGHPNATDFSQIRVTINEAPVARAGPDLVVAPGEPFRLSGDRSSDQDGTVTAWRWDVNETGAVLDGAEVEHRFEAPGVYTVTLTVTDDSSAGNRTAQDEMTVFVNHQPVAEAGRDVFSEALRIVFDATASADADNDGLAYLWDLGDGNTATGPVVEHTYQTGGVYPVLLTVDDGKGLSNSQNRDSMTVRINRAPLAIAGDNRQACVGDVVVFDGSSSTDPDQGLLRYSWDFGDGAASDIINPTKTFETPGTFGVRLTVTDESGLANGTHSAETLVTVLPAPVANAGEDLQICANTTVRFDGRRSTDIDGVVNRFSWDFGDGSSGGGDQPEHTYTDAGNYRVTLQIEGDNLGLCSPVSSDDLLVTVLPAPRAVITAVRAAAVGEEVVFDGAASYLDGGTVTGHAWDFGDGTTGAGAVVRHAFDRPGTYRVQLKALSGQDSQGCSSADTIHVITINAAPVAQVAGNAAVEVDQPLELSAAGSLDPDGGIASYRWDFGDGGTATGVEVRHIWRTPGTFPVTLTVSDGTSLINAENSTTFSVTVADAPRTAIEAAQAACAGERVSFGLSNLPGLADPDALVWSFGDGSNATGPAAVHVFAQPGTYSVSVKGPIDRAGEVLLTPVARLVKVNRPPAAIIEAERKTCPGQTVRFDASRSFDADGAIASYDWDFGDGHLATGPQVSHTFDRPGTYAVRMKATDTSGSACAATVETLEVFVNAPPVAEAGPDVDLFIGGALDSHVLDASGSRDADGDALDHYWTLSNGFESDGEKARVEITQPGDIAVELTTSDPHGLDCSVSTDRITIRARSRSQTLLLPETGDSGLN